MLGAWATPTEHRLLLPKPPPSAHKTEDTSSSSSSAGPGLLHPVALVPKKKKAPGGSSCDACRARKSGCDSQQPICSACRAKGTTCSYKGRDKLIAGEASKELLEMLRTLPEDESLQLLHKLRDSASSSAAVLPAANGDQHAVCDGRAPRRLPPLATTASGMDLELLTRYPIAYPTLMPVDVDAVPSPDTSHLEEDWAEEPYCDERLAQLVITQWTDVPIDNGLAARILSFYLRIDHPVLGLFDADLFLGDLVTGQHNFCAPMLVNVILAWASQAYGAVESEAARHKDAFLAEAKRRFEDLKHRTTLTAVATSHLLSLTATCHGQHNAAAHYLAESVAMGRHMGLYGATEEGSAKRWLDNHHQWIRAASHTAWGVYCAATHHALRYQSSLVEAPPLLPIPSEVGWVLERTKGERYEPYPTPAYMGQTFNYLCKFFRIAHKVLWAYYGGDSSDGSADGNPACRVTIGFAEDAIRELLAWSTYLPLELVRTESSPHHVVLLHLYFHCIMLDIVRPFYQHTEPVKLASFESIHPEVGVAPIYQASVDQLKRLVLFYLTKFHVASNSMLFHPALLYLFNALVREAKVSEANLTENSESNFYLRLCVLGFTTMSRSFDFVEELVKGVLAMAVRDEVLTTAAASKTFQDLHRDTSANRDRQGLGDGPDKRKARGHSLIVDLDLAMTDPPGATLDALTAQFDKITVLSDNGADSPSDEDSMDGSLIHDDLPNPEHSDKRQDERATPDYGFPDQ